MRGVNNNSNNYGLGRGFNSTQPNSSRVAPNPPMAMKSWMNVERFSSQSSQHFNEPPRGMYSYAPPPSPSIHPGQQLSNSLTQVSSQTSLNRTRLESVIDSQRYAELSKSINKIASAVNQLQSNQKAIIEVIKESNAQLVQLLDAKLSDINSYIHQVQVSSHNNTTHFDQVSQSRSIDDAEDFLSVNAYLKNNSTQRKADEAPKAPTQVTARIDHKRPLAAVEAAWSEDAGDGEDEDLFFGESPAKKYFITNGQSQGVLDSRPAAKPASALKHSDRQQARAALPEETPPPLHQYYESACGSQADSFMSEPIRLGFE